MEKPTLTGAIASATVALCGLALLLFASGRSQIIGAGLSAIGFVCVTTDNIRMRLWKIYKLQGGE